MDEFAERRDHIRRTFEDNLKVAGLELELEHKHVKHKKKGQILGRRCNLSFALKRNIDNRGVLQDSFDRKTYFLKIHAPKDLLDSNGSLLKIKRPVKEFIVTFYSKDPSLTVIEE